MQMMIRFAAIVDEFGDDKLARFVQAGLPTALLGILTVFAVLSILWGALEVFRYVFYTLPNKRNEEKQKAQVEQNVAPTQPEADVSDDAEIVAAIIAAITASRADEGISPSTSFRVVSFRKRK